MTKAEIKQIILEEIYSALKELKSPILTEMDEDGKDNIYEDMDNAAVELAASAFLDDMSMEEDVNEISLDDLKSKNDDDDEKTGKGARQYFLNQDKIATFRPEFAAMSDADQRRAIGGFMIQVIKRAIERSGRGAPKKFFTKEELSNLIKLIQSGPFTSTDVLNTIGHFTRIQQANKLLQAWKLNGWITFEPKGKSVSPTIRPAPPSFNLDDLNLDEQVKKYVYSYLKESSNIIGNKLKEIETTGKIAALEAKLAAIEEMVNASNERLTRIDEDEEFSEMMDTGKVNQIRKEVKQLEKTREKLQKEYAKTKNGKKSTKEPVMDEDKDIDLEENFYSKLNEEIGSKEKEYLLKAVESILDGDYGEPLKKGQSKIYSNVADKNDLEEEIPSLLNIGSNFITFEDDKNGTYKVRNNKNGGIEIKVTAKVDVANLEENFLPTKLNESILRMQKLAGL